ncbi:MAG TPA: hypothetical protein VGM82_16645 [Gemmatimonadaceae bacterium]|jgi:hypothetical protein
MSTRRFLPLLISSAALIAATAPSFARSPFKSPAWLSIEAPVNPWDPSTRGQALLVHTQVVNGAAKLSELSGTAEGLLNGTRRSVSLRFDSLARPSTFGVRRQWPNEGTWLLRIVLRETTALVNVDANGNPTTARVVTESSTGMPLPRAVADREIDSALTQASKR